MTYREALEYMNTIGQKGSVLGLDNMKTLLAQLDNPQDKVQAVHIAGTNGKGSTGAFLAAMLTEAGCRVGRYVSPAVVDEREIIRILQRDADDYITEEQFAQCCDIVKKAAERGGVEPTRFEAETAAAFVYFQMQDCDYMLIEVGLGGRMDATNVLTRPACCILTSISMDHMAVLGDTLEQIAGEKAGIIREGCPVVSAAQKKAAADVIRHEAERKNAPLLFAQADRIMDVQTALTDSGLHTSFRYEGVPVELSLAGENQMENAQTAIEAGKVLGLSSDTWKALSRVKWPGRFQLIGTKPWIIIDGAHNEGAALALRNNVKAYLDERRIILVMGVFADKEYDKILAIMRECASELVTFTTHTARALSAHDLAEAAENAGYAVTECQTPAEAMNRACEMADDEDVILAMGSLSFLGDILEWQKARMEQE